jgi:hypothetical protein
MATMEKQDPLEIDITRCSYIFTVDHSTAARTRAILVDVQGSEATVPSAMGKFISIT